MNYIYPNIINKNFNLVISRIFLVDFFNIYQFSFIFESIQYTFKIMFLLHYINAKFLIISNAIKSN